MKEICVVIPMFGKEEYTRKCTDLCIKHSGIVHDIVVVDDCSPIPYADNRVHILRLEKNRGYTGATNEGILYAQKNNYKYVLLLNNDTEPFPYFLRILYDAMEKDPVIGVASSSRKMVTDSPYCIELFGEDLIRGYQRMCDEKTDLPDVIHTHWVPICSALVRMDMIREIGILDKHMRTWCSDNDFCIRANFHGWNTSIVPKSRVLHIHQVTTGKTDTHKLSEGVYADQKVLLEKMANVKYAELMSKVPLDCESKTYGKLTFEVYKKT